MYLSVLTGRVRPRPTCPPSQNALCPQAAVGYCAAWMEGGFQVPSMMEGGVSLGQYRRIIGMNFARGAASQLASFAFPEESAWRYKSTEPSGLVTHLLRELSV